VIEISSAMFEPGVVQRHSGPDRSWFALGVPDGAADGRLQMVATLLRESGSVDVVADIRAAKWGKLVSNCTTLVTTAILGLSMTAAHARPGMRELMLAAGQEAFELGRALGIATLPIFGLRPEDVADDDRVVQTLLDTLYAGFILDHTTTTVLQDWTKGRRSEVDDLNGLVVAESVRLGRRAPVNAAVVQLAHRIERGELVPAVENLALLRELAGA
jgi:2-dehydropantoate 2-reductase